jgi:uncharacterized DUF497 family protein
MRILWDEPKRRQNIEKHGLDFASLDMAFFETALVAPAKSSRLKAINVFSDGTIAAVFATLGSEAISVVSMRPASKQERKLYEQSFSTP